MTTPPDSTKKTPSVARLEKMLPVLRERFGVIKIGIFGSTARGEERFDSDVDILVELSPEHLTFRNFTALADFLEEVYGRRVDLVTVGGLDPLIRQDVESEVIWCQLPRPIGRGLQPGSIGITRLQFNVREG
jgi:hypothetical protein